MMRHTSSVFRACVPPRVQAYVDYYFNPSAASSWGGPFNGQHFRQKMFLDILLGYEPEVLVETGCFRGTTTEFMATHTNAPIKAVELQPRYYYYTRLRLRSCPRVHLTCGDTNAFLRKLVQQTDIRDKRVFVYLDAHWQGRLPLKGELETLFSTCASVVAMVDDFKVPDDPGYGYDTYADGAISVECLHFVNAIGVHCYLPNCPSHLETGMRRGSAVLCSDTADSSIAQIASLREWLLPMVIG
jgi:hypothetical protein